MFDHSVTSSIRGLTIGIDAELPRSVDAPEVQESQAMDVSRDGGPVQGAGCCHCGQKRLIIQ